MRAPTFSFRKFLLCTAVFLLSLSLTPSLHAQYEFRYKVYDEGTGFTGAAGCVSDTFGYTWFYLADPRQNALVRFDGKEFKNMFSPTASRIVHVVVGESLTDIQNPLIRDNSGRVWMMGDSGITILQNGNVSSLLSSHNGLKNSSIISAVAVGRSSLCISTLKEVCIIDYNNGKYVIQPLADGSIGDFASDWSKHPNSFGGDQKLNVRLCSLDTDNFWMVIRRPDISSTKVLRLHCSDGKPVLERSYDLDIQFTEAYSVDGYLFVRTKFGETHLFDKKGVVGSLPKEVRRCIGKTSDGIYYFLDGLGDSATAISSYNISTLDEMCNLVTEKSASWPLPADIYYTHLNSDKIWLLGILQRVQYLFDGKILDLPGVFFKGPDLTHTFVWPCDDGTLWMIREQRKTATHILIEDRTKVFSFGNEELLSGISPICPGKKPGTVYFSTLPNGSGWQVPSPIYFFDDGNFKRIGEMFYMKSLDYARSSVLPEYNIDQKKWCLKSIVNDSTVHEQPFYFYTSADDDKGGSWLIDSSSLYYFAHDSIHKMPGALPENTQVVYWYKGDHVIVFDGQDVFEYKNDSWKQMSFGNSAHSPKVVYIQGGFGTCTFATDSGFYYTDHQGKMNCVDTVKYPMIAECPYNTIDINGRVIVWGRRGHDHFSNFWVMDGSKTTQYTLADSAEGVNFAPAEYSLPDVPPPVFNGTTLLVYNAATETYVRVYDFGKYLSYYWNAYVVGKNIYASGWGKNVVELKNFESVPRSLPLSFQNFTSADVEFPLFSPISLEYGKSISIHYIAIDPFDQSSIFYQTRLIGIDSSWSSLTKNESSEFQSLPPGHYRYEVRARNYSLLWGQPIGIDFDILPPWYRTTWAYCLWVILFLAIMFLLMKWNGRRLQQANKKLQHKISEATSEIQEQKNIIELHNKDITDSILYAKKIQQALLASEEMLRRNIPDHFVLYQPKDIVSGDFYWATLREDAFYLAVCDSTGHGVPGAFMSLLNISVLNEAITEKDIPEPGKIFDHARKRLIENLSATDIVGRESLQDGMDGVLIRLENKKLAYAGAYNSPVILRDGKVLDLETDKMPVGVSVKEANSFRTFTPEIKQGDIIYLFTDGYADQFGGPEGKKLKHKNLLKFISSIGNLSLDQQRTALETKMKEWKGNNDQIDDILVVGFRI